MTAEKRKGKPKKFARQDWHKRIKLGSTVKKKKRWRSAKGLHNKIRLGKKGHAKRPKVGWGLGKGKKGIFLVNNMKDLEKVKGKEIVIANVGVKKRKEIIAKANEMKLKILNRYKEKGEKSENAI